MNDRIAAVAAFITVHGCGLDARAKVWAAAAMLHLSTQEIIDLKQALRIFY